MNKMISTRKTQAERVFDGASLRVNCSGFAGRYTEVTQASALTGSLGKVLVVAPQPFYEDRGTPIAVRYVVRALTELGYEVDLLTYPLGSSPRIDGVRYMRLGNPINFGHVPVGFSWKKLFLDLLLAGTLPFVLRRNTYTYIHAVEEAAYLVALYRPLHKTRVIYDMASSIPEQLQSNLFFRVKPVSALCSWLERWLFERVDLVVASSGLEGIVQQLSPETRVKEWRFPSEPLEVPTEAIMALRAELGLNASNKVIVYTGTFEHYQGVEDIIAAMPMVLSQSPDTVFVLVGATETKQIDYLYSKVEPSLAAQIRILPRKSKQEINCFLALSDILISTRRCGRNIPLKIFDYLAAAKPIVVTNIEAHRAVLDDTLAVLVSPDADGIAGGINLILKDKKRMEELTRASSHYAEKKLSWESFLAFMKSLPGDDPDKRARALAIEDHGS